jgi:hemerythrin-like domain-containing protein
MENEMKATQILMEEHEIITRVLGAVEKAAGRLSHGEKLRPAFFINVALFNKNFTDGCHHKKEEGVLFKAMNAAGVQVEGGPIGVMLAEHEKGRLFTQEMRDAAEKWEKGDLSAVWAVTQNALGYVQLLRQHIYKENNILFPMADQVIPADQQEKLVEGFERVELEETGEGVHEKYEALAEVLEKESVRKI